MKKNYIIATLSRWIATDLRPRNDESETYNPHCERHKTRGNPVLTSGWENKKAFSLIELLISLVLISLITAAFAPIYTKKLAKNSMTVKIADAKKGLQIYTNPGSYSFDVPEAINKIYFTGAGGGGGGAGATKTTKNVSYSANGTFIVPMAVNAITFTITGSGGGGGASNGASTGRTSCSPIKVPEFLAIRGADTEEDLCYFKRNGDVRWAPIGWNTTKASTETCGNSTTCCWDTYSSEQCTSPGGMYSGCNRQVCTIYAANTICANYGESVVTNASKYRLPTFNEINKVVKYIDTWSRTAMGNGLELCTGNFNNPGTIFEGSNVPKCQPGWQCRPAFDNFCGADAVWASNPGKTYVLRWLGRNSIFVGETVGTHSASVRCVRPLIRYTRFSGAGGASGAQLTKTISVLPNDKFEIQIGQGGTGGVVGSANGKQGGETIITHWRGSTKLGVFSVKGALGGYGATASANGAPNAASNCTDGCTIQSYQGTAGSQNSGGSGGRVKNQGTATKGGELYIDPNRTANQRATSIEIEYAKGKNATAAGFGGGGGFTPPWAASSNNFYQGGRGGNGKVDISYDLITPGGGGGAGANADEIEYKVTPGERLVFTIGKGGIGGASNQAGKNGSATTIMENHIIFNPGSGGTFGNGGNGGVLKINTSKAKPKEVSGVSTSNIGLGQKGERGQMLPNINFGFDGGSGGTTFLGYFGGCGGGIIQDENTQRACQTPSRQDAVETRTHNAVKNEYGGSGGGGGGVKAGSTTLGAGSDGADGYLRIRWGQE